MYYNYLENYLSALQSQGKYYFTFPELTNHFDKGKNALQMALARLSQKHRILRIRKGFYIIIPAEYNASRILPASFFIHDLMVYLNKKYYAGLLSAAALHGAGHQQPQTFQIITEPPQIRPIILEQMKIQFIVKQHFPTSAIIQKKSDTGYFNISNPEMTALDLLQFQRQSGGFTRTLEILEELAENFTISGLKQALTNNWPAAVLQRFGFLCKYLPDCLGYTPLIHSKLKAQNIHPARLSLATSGRAGKIDKNWMIIKNVKMLSEA